MPRAILAVVDFPEPFGPISVTISPFFTSKETPLTKDFPFTEIPIFSTLSSIFLFSRIILSLDQNNVIL